MMNQTNVGHTPGRAVGFSFEIREGIGALPTEYPSDCGCTITAKQTGVGFDYCPTHAAAPALLEALEEAFTVIGEGFIDGDSSPAAWPQLAAVQEQARLAIEVAHGR